MVFTLLVIMGIPWIFEVLSFTTGIAFCSLWILPNMLNALRGVFIFSIFVCKPRVVKQVIFLIFFFNKEIFTLHFRFI